MTLSLSEANVWLPAESPVPSSHKTSSVVAMDSPTTTAAIENVPMSWWVFSVYVATCNLTL